MTPGDETFRPWAPTNKLVEAIVSEDLVLLLLLAPRLLLLLGEARKGDPAARTGVHDLLRLLPYRRLNDGAAFINHGRRL